MNFPLDQLYEDAFKNSPFKEVAFYFYVTGADINGRLEDYLSKPMIEGVPYEASIYGNTDMLCRVVQRSLQLYKYPSGKVLDAQIEELFRIWMWIAEWKSTCFVQLSDEKSQFREFWNPSSSEFRQTMQRLSKHMNTFVLSQDSRQADFQDMEEVRTAYRRVKHGHLQIPAAEQGETDWTEAKKYNPAVVDKLLGTNTKPTNDDALVPILMYGIGAIARFFHSIGQIAVLERCYREDLGADSFNVLAFLNEHNDYMRLKFGQTEGSEVVTDIDAAASAYKLYTNEAIMTLEQDQEATTHLNVLFALAGYRYTHLFLPAEEEFASVVRVRGDVHQDVFKDILVRHCARDRILRAGKLESVRMLRPNFDYILQWATGASREFGVAPDHDFEYTAVPWEVTLAKETSAVVLEMKRQRDAGNSRAFWLIGAVCLGGFVLLNS